MNVTKTNVSFLFCFLVLLIGESAFADMYTWTGKAMSPDNHDWLNADNWSPDTGPPSAGDSVSIGGASGGFVVDIDSDEMVDQLTIVNSEIDGTGALEVEKSSSITFCVFALTEGLTLKGDTDIYPLNSVDTETETDDAFVNLSQLELHDDTTFIIGPDTVVENNSQWFMDVRTKLSMPEASGSSFVNTSALILSNAGVFSSGAALSNAAGAGIFVQTDSTNQYEAGLASAGEVNVASNALLSIDSSSRIALSTGADFSGRGTTLINCPVSVTGTATVDGQVQFMTDGANSPTAITINGGLEILAGGVFNWYGGSFNGVGTNLTGVVTVDDGGKIIIFNDDNGLGINNAFLTNGGTIIWTNNGGLQLANSAQIINGGDFFIDNDSLLHVLNGDPSPVAFQNFGSVTKRYGSTNGGETEIQGVPFYDNGDVFVEQGTLHLVDGGSINNWLTAEDANLKISGGTFTVNQGAKILGAGPVTMTGPAMIDVPEDATLKILGLFIQAGGTIFGSGSVDLVPPGIFMWEAGTISITNAESAMVVEQGAEMYIEGPSNPKTLVYGTLQNSGTVTWANDNSVGGINLGNRAGIDNLGAFNVQCDAYMTDVSGTNAPFFYNEETGTLSKTVTPGRTTIGVKFVDDGTIVAQSGTLEFYNFDDDYIPGQPLPVINLNGGKIQIDNSLVLHANIFGNGQLIANKPLTLSGGSLTVVVIILTGDITDDETFDLGSFFGFLTIQGNFSMTEDGTILISMQGTNSGGFGHINATGNVNLGGTVKAVLTNGYAAPIGLSFPILAGLQRNGSFTNLVLPQGMGVSYSGNGAAIVVTNIVPTLIGPPGITGGEFQFGFGVVNGREYTVQYKLDLNAPSWAVLTNFVAASTNVSFTLPVTTSPTLFVRVLEP